MFGHLINKKELKLGGEIPILLRLRMRKLLRRRAANTGEILVIDTCLIGDFMGTLPALRQFIRTSGREVDLVVAPPMESLAGAIRGVRRVFTAESVYTGNGNNASEYPGLLRSYGLVLVLRIGPAAYKLLKQVTCSNIILYDVQYFRYVGHLIKNIVLKRPVKQWRTVNYEIVGQEPPEDDGRFDDLFDIDALAYARARSLMPDTGGGTKLVLIHPGSGWSVKLWSNEKWAELLRQLNALDRFTFLIIGGGEFERRSFEEIQKNLDFRIFSLIDRADLLTTLLIMRMSHYFIGIDSGPRNMAHITDLRSITFLGPAPNNFMPRNRKDIVINKFTCRCKSLVYLHRTSALQKLPVDEVVSAFKQLAGILSNDTV